MNNNQCSQEEKYIVVPEEFLTANKKKQIRFLNEARTHFKLRCEELRNRCTPHEWNERNTCMSAYGWEYIRKLVLWSYEVCVVEDLPDDKQQEINQYAIKLIDNVFDQYAKMWDEG